MGVRVAAGTAAQLAAAPGTVALRALVEDPSHVPAAVRAARLARVDLLGLAAGGRRPGTPAPRLTPVVDLLGGPLLVATGLDLDEGALAAVPGILADRLQAAAIDATVAAVGVGGPLDALDEVPSCAVLRLFGAPGGPGPGPDWVEVASAWALAGDPADGPAAARVLGVELAGDATVPARHLAAAATAGAWADLVVGDLAGRLRVVSVTYGRLPHLALAVGGPGAGPDELAELAAPLLDIARELAADLAYACLDLEPTFAGLALGPPVDGWRALGGADPVRVAAHAVDVVVPDAFAWQLLGRGHTARLAAARVRLGDVAEPLGDGRSEVVIATLAEWAPGTASRAAVRSDAIELLDALLVDDEELAELEAARAGWTGPASGFDDAALPDLAGVRLVARPTRRRSSSLTLLELAAWLGGLPHGDDPATVARPLATYARLLAAALDDDRRAGLVASAARLVGTAGDAHADRARCWQLAGSLAALHAPAWLRAAGLHDVAARLAPAAVGAGPAEAGVLVEGLGATVATAARHHALTVALAAVGEDDDARDAAASAAWAAWEGVAEATGWVAASEAATDDTSGEVAARADQRVIELARHAHEEGPSPVEAGIGRTAWQSALDALAGEAWEQGWRAADEGGRAAAGIALRPEMSRAAVTALGADESGAALDVAERAARDALVRAALRRGGGNAGRMSPWDEGFAAAQSSEGAGAWAEVVDAARRAVGDGTWASAMADARTAVDATLADAGDVVDRVVVVALAREASGLAARCVAHRAAAVAIAGGDDADDAAAAALAPWADVLSDAAVALLTELVAPPP